MLYRNSCAQYAATVFVANTVLEITFSTAMSRVDEDAEVNFYRKTHAAMEVVYAIALSLALPPLFRPGMYKDNLFIDGGVSNNFPRVAP